MASDANRFVSGDKGAAKIAFFYGVRALHSFFYHRNHLLGLSAGPRISQ
jgi:hypothetical protein